MKKRPSALHKFFSISRWQRRKGANQLVNNSSAVDVEAMKSQIIDLGAAVLSRGSSKDLTEHHATLRQEFSGQPELVFHHAFLIVLIRRDHDLQTTFQQFEQLWKEHTDWLLQHLNIRWLVSACDTFADHSPSPTERALGLATSVLANTVKIYETENVMSHHMQASYDSALVAEVQQKAIPLMEGMSCFTVGTDDTLRNMVWRVQAQQSGTVCGQILFEVLKRFNSLPTAYGRLRQAHTRDKTRWWND